MRKAVVDVGSNSVLLLIAENRGSGWVPVFESSKVTGLGVGTKVSGLLGEAGIDATLAALREAKSKADTMGASEFLAAATMAARIATNANEFLVRANAQGTPVQVLSGEHEAELGFLAVAEDPLFADADRISIVDPGGQSTELVTASRIWHQPAGAVVASSHWKVEFRRSYPVGALGLREGVLKDETPDFMARLKASQHLDEVIGLEYRPAQSGVVIALGATGTNLITIREKMTTWDAERVHGASLEYEEISRAADWMMNMSDEQRSQIVGIEPGREKTLHIGCLILERFLFALRAEGCRVSARGWRHALLERGFLAETESYQ